MCFINLWAHFHIYLGSWSVIGWGWGGRACWVTSYWSCVSYLHLLIWWIPECVCEKGRERICNTLQQSNPNTCEHWKACVLDPWHCVLFVSMHTARVTLIRLVKVWQQINIRLKRHCVLAHLATWCKKPTTVFVFWFKTHTKFLKLYSIRIVLWSWKSLIIIFRKITLFFFVMKLYKYYH